MVKWMDEWVEVKAGLRIAYSNIKSFLEEPTKADSSCIYCDIQLNHIGSLLFTDLEYPKYGEIGNTKEKYERER